jgi:hypothetical protein
VWVGVLACDSLLLSRSQQGNRKKNKRIRRWAQQADARGGDREDDKWSAHYLKLSSIQIRWWVLNEFLGKVALDATDEIMAL